MYVLLCTTVVEVLNINWSMECKKRSYFKTTHIEEEYSQPEAVGTDTYEKKHGTMEYCCFQWRFIV